MQRYEIDCFKVVESYDRDSWTIAYASSEHVAKQIAAHKDKNYRHVTTHKQTIVVVDSLEEYLDLKNENLRKAALAKLTDAEKTALGL